MYSQAIVTLVTAVFSAVAATLVTQKLLPFLAMKFSEWRTGGDPQLLKTLRRRRLRKKKGIKSILVSATAGGIVGGFLGIVLISPMINSSCPPFGETKVNITSPLQGSAENRLVAVQGTACNIPSREELWLLVVPDGVTAYYPQSGPIKVARDGTWSSTAYIGLDGNVDLGRGFTIFTVVTDEEGSKIVRNYFTQSSEYKGIEPLPETVQLMSRVRVVRK